MENKKQDLMDESTVITRENVVVLWARVIFSPFRDVTVT